MTVTDLLLAAFTALLVFAAMHIPRLGDAIGRALRGRDAPRAPGGDASGERK